MKQLIREYRQSLKRINKFLKNAEEHEQKIYSSMITDLEIAISWMASAKKYGISCANPERD